jgi:phytoene desaturase
VKKRIGIIGSGFAGLSAAAFLAADGHDVSIYEKNDSIGGRARKFSEQGFTFDMGPSWYWMPDVMEDFFALHGSSAKEHFDLVELDPAFSIFFGVDEKVDIPSNYQQLQELFESLEPGSAAKLDKFMTEAQYKYEVGMKDLVYKPSLSLGEFMTRPVMSGVFRMQLFSSFSKHVRKYFSHPWLISLMEFPVLFLGAMPERTPALYSLMNYAGLKLGTWYPIGGFSKLVEGMSTIAVRNGAKIHLNHKVSSVTTNEKSISHLNIEDKVVEVDAVLGSADYNHVEQQLLPAHLRSYSEEFWSKKTMAPSSLLFYVGVNKKIDGLNHHNLFFDADFKRHAREIYESPAWPEQPLFYVCCPSKTDDTVAPEGHENLFILMPIAAGLEDKDEIREQYFDLLLARLEKHTGQQIKNHVVYKRSYCVNDFKKDYNAYKGNAYGLANTLRQTAILRPSVRSKKVNNLFYAGQLTVPGPGVPPSIISGQVAAAQINQFIARK